MEPAVITGTSPVLLRPRKSSGSDSDRADKNPSRTTSASSSKPSSGRATVTDATTIPKISASVSTSTWAVGSVRMLARVDSSKLAQAFFVVIARSTISLCMSVLVTSFLHRASSSVSSPVTEVGLKRSCFAVVDSSRRSRGSRPAAKCWRNDSSS